MNQVIISNSIVQNDLKIIIRIIIKAKNARKSTQYYNNSTTFGIIVINIIIILN